MNFGRMFKVYVAIPLLNDTKKILNEKTLDFSGHSLLLCIVRRSFSEGGLSIKEHQNLEIFMISGFFVFSTYQVLLKSYHFNQRQSSDKARRQDRVTNGCIQKRAWTFG
jgi:hypothetical protein